MLLLSNRELEQVVQIPAAPLKYIICLDYDVCVCFDIYLAELGLSYAMWDLVP